MYVHGENEQQLPVKIDITGFKIKHTIWPELAIYLHSYVHIFVCEYVTY